MREQPWDSSQHRFALSFWVFEEIAERAEHELNDDEQVTADLAEANRQLEAGLISPDEFNEREAELVRRLEEIDARTGRGGSTCRALASRRAARPAPSQPSGAG